MLDSNNEIPNALNEKKNISPFNVDDLVRKIDAKIAALEEEEKINKEKEEKEKKASSVEVIGDKDSELFHKVADSVKPNKELNIEEEEEDDEFFDDFFDN